MVNKKKVEVFPESKKGWIRIVEAFVVVLIITGVLLVIIDREYVQKDASETIYEVEVSILREIELDNNLREDILNAEPLPVNWSEFDSAGLENVKEKITNRTPTYLNCEAKICETDDICDLNKNIEKDVYVKSVIITATLETYSPRKLNLFCWMK